MAYIHSTISQESNLIPMTFIGDEAPEGMRLFEDLMVVIYAVLVQHVPGVRAVVCVRRGRTAAAPPPGASGGWGAA